MSDSSRIDKLERQVTSLIDIVILQQKMLHEMLYVQARLQSQIDGAPVEMEPLPPVMTRAEHKVESLKRLLELHSLSEGEKPQ